MGKKTTLQQIAQKVGTSKITVSRALKGQEGVGDTLRKQIRQVASDLGYEQKRLHTGGHQIRVAFLTPKRFYLFTDSFYHVIYYHLNTICNEREMKLDLFIMEKEDEEKGSLPDGLDHYDGIIVGGEISRTIMNAINGISIPHVVVDYDPMDDHSDCVSIDNFRIGTILAEYLVRRGYRKIGFVGSYLQSSNIADRILGYRKVQYYHHLPNDESWLIDNYDKDTDNYLIDIPLPKELPEVFICHCDRAAYYFMERLKSLGISIPGQVAIVSIDNTELAASTKPPLTSMNIDKRLFASEALRLLEERIEGRNELKRIYLDTQLIERDSAPRR
ncbi:MAG: LacI family DNA-binding transcriptional regulator [Spirochaetia bacterium]|jgi:LacI family transcriptional regulator|nr:LacI family DNA-binding transcriptional regulator [Spirochaetia bacterium]